LAQEENAFRAFSFCLKDTEGHERCAATEMAHKAYVSLGSNLGNAEENLSRARDQIRLLPGVQLASCSALYTTEPQGIKDQPWFLNQVAGLECEPFVDPRTLLDSLLRIETRLGRKRTMAMGPRMIDLDLLLFDDRVVQSEELVLPHPRMRERAFVLVPLREICPGFVFPDGMTIDEALSRVVHTLKEGRIMQD
jgi:2-amino-4-hydroxy-6-hydroxymethyldihydropteridine diphosphokinase